MPRTNTTAPTDAAGWRNFGDGLAAPMVAARLQGYNTANADYRDVAVDASGNLLAALTASAIEIGTVDQGTGGSSAWKVDGSAVTQPVSATALPLPTGAAKDSTLTDGTQRIGGTVAVSIAAMPSTPVTGPLTDTQLRASAVPVSGTVTASGPLTDTQLRATAVPVSGTVTASGPLTDTQLRASAVPVSLAAETTKVIGVTRSADGSGNLLSSTAAALDVNVKTDAVGIAKDASLTAIFGAATSDSPAAFTVLDQLSRIRKAEESTAKTLQQVLAALTPSAPRKTQTTLLHRS